MQAPSFRAELLTQWGTWGPDGQKRSKKENGRHYRGRVWDAMPALPL